MQAWTYSHLDKFETCPKQFYHGNVARDYVSQPTEATKWGERVHTAFENWINEGTPLPEGMTQWQPIADKIAAMPGEKNAEGKIAIDRNLSLPRGRKRGVGALLTCVLSTTILGLLLTTKPASANPQSNSPCMQPSSSLTILVSNKSPRLTCGSKKRKLTEPRTYVVMSPEYGKNYSHG